jgi:3-deoxy-manno-octulosonate cytidylyltransferase (CMP-KDO synthetase)
VTWIVIPARLGSTRLPSKPLADLGGTPMVVRVAQAAARCQRARHVRVATDSAEVQALAVRHGFDCVLTRLDHPSGTDRVGEALPSHVAHVVNWQGDEPFLDPLDVDRLIAELESGSADMVTLASNIDEAESQNPHVTKVVCSEAGDAMYFSRAPIPHGCSVRLGHVGVYGYRADVLRALCKAPPTLIERAERLEQLRALGLGFRIRVLTCASRSRGIDTAEDLAVARRQVMSRAP